MKKRIFSLLMSLVMVISLVGVVPTMLVGAETNTQILCGENKYIPLNQLISKAKSNSRNKYWVVFYEGYRNNRLEMSSFDSIGNSKVIWNKSLHATNQYGKVTQYYFNGNEFEKIGNYSILTDYATKIVASNINIYDNYGNIKFYKNTTSKKLSNVTGFKTSSISTNSIKLKWNKVSGADGYIIYRYDNSKKSWTRIAKGKYNGTYTVKKLKAGTSYKFAVKAYKTSGKKEITSSKFPQVTTSTMPAKVSFRLSSSTNKATVKWLKVNGASGYKVYYKTSKSGKWTLLKICSNKTISYTKTGLTKGKTYWFTVKAYRKVGKLIYNGKYTTKKVLTKLSSKNIPKATISKATLNLSLVDNSTYQLKVSTYLQGTVRWHSSNNSVVKVDSKGNVKAIGSGTAEITASINNYKMKCKVSVSDKSYKTITINPISLEDWKKKIDKVESSMIGYPSYFNLSNGQKINTSRIILNRKILEYKTLTDRIPEFVQGPNAQVRYKTIKVKVPIKIKYTLHKHSLNNDSSAEAVGKFLYGAVNQNVVVLQQKCSCGLKCELSWQMPLEEFNTVATGNTYIVSTTSANK